MAWNDLQPNQMVNGNDATTGGFVQIGPTNAANECYTKARALATYQLNASNMASFADNQLVPKNIWASGVIVFNFATLAYSGLNGMGGFNSNFNTARTVGTSNDQTTGGVSSATKIGASYSVDRMFIGFDTTLLTSIVIGGIQIGLDNNQLSVPTQYVVVKTNSTFAANHAWVHADFNEGIGGTIVSDIVTINNGQSGLVQFPFNTAGLSYVNANNSATFVIMQYVNDYGNVAPNTNNNYVFSFNTNMKLYYA